MTTLTSTATPPTVRVRPHRLRWWRPLALLVGIVALGGASWMVGQEMMPRRSDAGSSSRESAASALERQLPHVDVIRPRRGGIQRMTTQPGSVHAFESVDLLSMVSGFLKAQGVDIGSRVKKGQVLAEIDAPREAKAVVEAVAMLDQAKAQADQARARARTTEAERNAASAAVAQARGDIDRHVARRKLSEAQFSRIKGLHDRAAVERKLVDEQQHDLDSAVAAEQTARLAVLTAEAQRATADARVRQGQSDVAAADATVEVAEARLSTARVDVEYTRIVAPFDGVVTHRSYHPGAFIRSASDGGQLPLLTVMRTDLMRVVVRVADRDVVLASAGDPAVVDIDALGGRSFSGTVARIGESEDPTTRTMRIEIDLPNPEGVLREGMYGRARITLEADSPNLTVPAACVVEHSGKTHGTACVVRDGKVYRTKVELGTDNGTLVEILSGLGQDDSVVVRSNDPLEDGSMVVAAAAVPVDARH